MMRRPWLSWMVSALAVGLLAGCAAPPETADTVEEVATVAQAEVGPTDIRLAITWYDNDDNPDAEEPTYTPEFVAGAVDLVDYQLEWKTHAHERGIITPDIAKGNAFALYLAQNGLIGSRVEVVIGDPGRRW